MKRFADFIKLRENQDLDGEKTEILHRIVDAAWQKHRPLFKELLDKLANNDPDLEREIKKLGGEGSNLDDPMKRFHSNPDKDEVKPPEADGSPGLGEDGNDGM
jgi:hypothetical protein